MTEMTTIGLSKTIRDELGKLKLYPRETYGDTVERLLKYKNFNVVDGKIVWGDADVTVEVPKGDVQPVEDTAGSQSY